MFYVSVRKTVLISCTCIVCLSFNCMHAVYIIQVIVNTIKDWPLKACGSLFTKSEQFWPPAARVWIIRDSLWINAFQHQIIKAGYSQRSLRLRFRLQIWILKCKHATLWHVNLRAASNKRRTVFIGVFGIAWSHKHTKLVKMLQFPPTVNRTSSKDFINTRNKFRKKFKLTYGSKSVPLYAYNKFPHK